MQNRKYAGLTLYVTATTWCIQTENRADANILFQDKTDDDGWKPGEGQKYQKIKRDMEERIVVGTLRENCTSMK